MYFVKQQGFKMWTRTDVAFSIHFCGQIAMFEDVCVRSFEFTWRWELHRQKDHLAIRCGLQVDLFVFNRSHWGMKMSSTLTLQKNDNH